MPDPIPTDDLYARLGLAADADGTEIERAWRGLLKQHHPDVAGPASLEAAKRINVAHDWLSDTARRARYDAAHRVRRGWRGRPSRAGSGPRPRPARPAPPEPSAELIQTFSASAAAIAAFLDRARRLTRDDVDRLSVSEPFLFAPRIRHLLPAELVGRLDALDRLLAEALGPERWSNRRLRASARAYGHSLVLDAFLWLQLVHPEPLLEQTRKGWEASVGFPRYGPNTPEVATFVERCAAATADEAQNLVRAWRRCGLHADPWPEAVAADDYAALEVSAALARHDAEAALRLDGLEGRARAAALRAFRRSAHVVALRPIFSADEYAAHGRPWAELLEPQAAMAGTAGQGGTGYARVRRATTGGPRGAAGATSGQRRTSSSNRPT